MAYCQVCALAWRPTGDPVVPPAPVGDLQAMFAEVVRRHLAEGAWGLVAVAPLGTLQPALQRELTRSFGLAGRALVLVFEPTGEAAGA
jgi:hypothetical protein